MKKTGSKTILLGGKLAGKSIIRIIEEETFLVWKSLFENKRLWEENGFDYIPIEPIQKYKKMKDGKYRVYCEVLDCNLEELESSGNILWLIKLNNIGHKILKVLRDNNIKHGHPHYRNFCVKFYRKEDRSINYKICPRLYLIDWDMSRSHS